jgi:hypothetical protein
MNIFTPFFIPDSHKRICESGLSGQRHFGTVLLRGKSSKIFADVDGLQELQAVIVLNVRWRIARRSRPPQINIFARLSSQWNLTEMPLTDQVKSRQNYSRNKTI